MPSHRPGPSHVVLLALVLVLSLVACGGDGDAGDGGSGGGATPVADDGGGSGAGGAGETTPGPSAAPQTSGAPGASSAPGARFDLVASPDNAECSYVPNGHLSGADLLNVHFFFLIIGGNPPDVPAVTVSGSSDSGLSASYSSGPNNQAVSTAQFALRPGDFGRSHTLTVTVDSSNQVAETDESDNRIRVSVALPSPRPSQAIDPLPCSVSRG